MRSVMDLFAGIASLPLGSLTILLGSLTIGWYLLFPGKRERALASLPRPKTTLPVLGNTLDIMFKQRNRFHDWLFDECLHCNGRPWVLTSIGRPPSLILSSVATFEDVMRNQFEIFIKGKMSTTISHDVFGDGIFAVDGIKWIHQRKTASHLFSSQMVRDIMENVIVEKSTTVCEILEKARQEKSQVDIKNLMDYYATDVFAKIGFGIDMGCLKNEQSSDFFHAFSRLPRGIFSRVQQPMWLWQLKRFLNVSTEKQLRIDLKLVDGIIYDIISKSMHTKATRSEDEKVVYKDLISLFLSKEANTYPDGDTTQHIETTPKLIRDMTFNFIAAGRGTTAIGLDWFVVMMNRYPMAEKKVQEELQKQLPELCDGTKNVPNLEDIQKLTYLEAAIRESLRLYPPAPLLGRTANQDTTLSDGTFLRAGTRVVIPAYASARLPSIWGEDAAEYRPERWIDPVTGKLIAFSPFKYLVFYGGPRSCLGMKLAMMELKVVLAAIMSKYKIRFLRDPFNLEYNGSLSLPIKGELYATIDGVPSKLSAPVSPKGA